MERRLQQQHADQLHGGFQDPVTGKGEAVIHKGAVEAGGLVIAHPSGQSADAGAVQIVQPLGDGAQIRVFPAATEQHRRQQRV